MNDTVSDQHFHNGHWYGTVEFGDGAECGYAWCENPWPGALAGREQYLADLVAEVGLCAACGKLPHHCVPGGCYVVEEEDR